MIRVRAEAAKNTRSAADDRRYAAVSQYGFLTEFKNRIFFNRNFSESLGRGIDYGRADYYGISRN